MAKAVNKKPALCAGFLLAKPRIAARSALSGLPDLQTAMNRVGYRSADGGEPVARARRVKRRPREQGAVRQNSRRRCCASVRATRPADGGEWGSQTAVNCGVTGLQTAVNL